MSTKRIPINPLRYPGSKSRFYKQFRDFFCQLNLSGRRIVEPYAGSASISLSLLADGLVTSAQLIERDPLIFSFWKSVFLHTEELVDAIKEIPVNMESWADIRKNLHVTEPDESRTVELGLAGLFLNRTNFSGVLHAGPIGGASQSSSYAVDCRFNKDEIISRIEIISKYREKVDVCFGDAVDFLKKNRDDPKKEAIYYIDPPYFKEGKKLYRHYYDTAEHTALARTLAESHFDWILSYDAHHVIEHLYADFSRIDKVFRYSSKTPKKGLEFLITNMNVDVKHQTGMAPSKAKSEVSLGESFLLQGEPDRRSEPIIIKD
jgi:DNA adenine methylase